MAVNNSDVVNRINYKLDLLNWYDSSMIAINENKKSISPLIDVVINNNLEYYNVFVENNFEFGNVDLDELNEIGKYIDSIENYYDYLIDRNREYAQLLTEINQFIKNGEIASEQASQILDKFSELKATRLLPPEFNRKVFDALPKLSPEAKGLLTESNNKILQAHYKMSTLENVANNISYTIKSIKENGEYQGFDYVEALKQYGELIRDGREYINSQYEKLKSNDLIDDEISEIHENIESMEESIAGYLEWAEKAEPILNKHGIDVFRKDIPVSGLLNISMDIFDQLSISMAGINVLDSTTFNDIGMNISPSVEIMLPVQVN
ncbi:TPA: hypothetical protein ACS7ZY_001587 [Providencia alcalifaciens]